MTTSNPARPTTAVDDASDIHYITTDPDAEAPPDPWRRGFTRRRLLQGGAALGCAALGSQLITTRYAFAQDVATTADTIVVLTFRGGIDGLSAVVPRDPALRDLRPNIGVPESVTQRLDDKFGLHPGLAPLMPLYQKGQLAFVHGAGMPDPNYSHFSAGEKVEHGSQRLLTGWCDRFLAARAESADATLFSGVALGDSLPTSFAGAYQEIAMPGVDRYRLEGNDGGRLSGVISKLWDPLDHPASPKVASTLASFDTVRALSTAGYVPANGAEYPDSSPGRAMQDVARLIKAGLGLQVATVDMGGWDTHTNMGNVDDGDMSRHLGDVGEVLSAFATDLGDEWLAKTVLVTSSEFGRRVKQNDSGGTDHGYGNCMFVLGGGINGGRVYGAIPGFGEDDLREGNLPATTDMRNVFTEIAVRRGGLGSSTTMMPDLEYTPLGITKGR